MSANKYVAQVKLSSEDRKQVPNRDFVLMIRDEMVNKPVGLVKTAVDGA